MKVINKYQPKSMDLIDVQIRVHQKYAITWSDAELAIKYLYAFFDAKRQSYGLKIILPQVADWAWHEFILDTRRYREFCFQFQTGFVSHVKEELSNSRGNPRQDFENSMQFLRESYGLGLGKNPAEWMEAGWDTPMYRLRSPVRPRDTTHSQAVQFRDLESRQLFEVLASWLPSRLVQRFDVSPRLALEGVAEHAENLAGLRLKHAFRHHSILSQIAWEEHILWTDRYAKDCQNLLGYFLDHEPRNLASMVVADSMKLAPVV